MDSRRDPPTRDYGYTASLVRQESVWWKRWLPTQWPYRWNIRSLRPGFTLDIGCGLGRHLVGLRGRCVGIDHNPHSVAVARARGLEAYTPEEFQSSVFKRPHRFDSLLLSHVAEHMTVPDVVSLLLPYVSLLRAGGKIILITPQERGYASDPTHVQFMSFVELRTIAHELGFVVIKEYSFPLPRFLGGLFKYNEFISVSKRSTDVPQGRPIESS